MPLFPSEAWMAQFCERLRSDPDAGRTAEELQGRYRFVVEPAGPLRSAHSYDLTIAPADGGADVAPVDGDGEPRLAIAADYRRWQQLIRGELDITIAVMLRRVRVFGDLAGLRRSLSNAQPLLAALRAVDTQWIDE